MCGIFGYTGSADAIPKMKEGLSRLEYRGYDSVGIAAVGRAGVEVVKCRGRIADLEEREDLSALCGCCAIGHTRWATHGAPDDVNAHPHRVGLVTLVHNGIIENHAALRKEEELLGRAFCSETDTEVAAAVIDRLYCTVRDPIKTLQRAVARLRGAYAFGILFADFPDRIYALRRHSPLLIAQGEDGSYLSSDMTALLGFTPRYCIPREGEIVCLEPARATLHLPTGEAVSPNWQRCGTAAQAAEKAGHAHFMHKEIFEEREAVSRVCKAYVKEGLPDFSAAGITADFLCGIRRVQIVACGSAMHAGMIGARFFESLAGIPSEVHVASEYRYHPPLCGERTLVAVISQSGETADTLAALQYAKRMGYATLAVVNVEESSIAREAAQRIFTYAGPEIAVATTKGYATQVAVLLLLGAAMGHSLGRLPEREARALAEAMTEEVPTAIRAVLQQERLLSSLAKPIAQREHAFFIGRGLDSALSAEGALKLKEISYVHAEAYAAGELKHGTISLVEEGTPVIAICTDPVVADKTESNVREVESRGAEVLLICRAESADHIQTRGERFALPASGSLGVLFGCMVALQLLAYHTALLRGCDIDRPRNLAKSVTVE